MKCIRISVLLYRRSISWAKGIFNVLQYVFEQKLVDAKGRNMVRYKLGRNEMNVKVLNSCEVSMKKGGKHNESNESGQPVSV